jgi:hypothetical protein
MAKDKENEKSVEQRLEELSATVGAMQAENKRHSENWKAHMRKFHDENGGGKVGGATLWGMILAGILACACAFGVSRDETGTAWNYVDDTGTNDTIQLLKTGDIKIDGSLYANGTNVTVSANTTNMSITGTIGATGDATLEADVAITSNLTVGGTAAITGASTMTGAAALNGGATFDTDRVVIDNTTGNATFRGDLQANTLTASNAVNVTLAKPVFLSGSLNVTGRTAIVGALSVTGNTAVAGTMDVVGNASFNKIYCTTNGYFDIIKTSAGGTNMLVFLVPGAGAGCITNVVSFDINVGNMN